MRIIILGIADDIHQAETVARALDRCGCTVKDVTVLLVCADGGSPRQRPQVSLHQPALIVPPAEWDEAAGASVAITAQARMCGTGIVAGWESGKEQRPPTVTGNAHIALPAICGITRDLRDLGLAAPDARRIAAVVRLNNVLLLVEERPGCDCDDIIDTMLDSGVAKVFMVMVADRADLPAPADAADVAAPQDAATRPARDGNPLHS